MVKVMAVLRTLVLLALAGLLLWYQLEVGTTAATIQIGQVVQIFKVAWLAIAWIALETVFGWTKTWYLDRKKHQELVRAHAEAVAAAAATKKDL
jgi:hypothetical protein